ncbi:MAG: TetR/AcrR family transcriptional regulator [Planctomyces sp.]|nr:TetR/AcrR family transcriptional regulator [Planctomyces sp.]
MNDVQNMSRTEQKHFQILEAGRELFFAQGYADTSMDQVTSKSGVSKATVYNHFPSKEKLFEEVVRNSSEEVFSRLPPLDPHHPDLVEMLTDFFCTLTSILFSAEGSCMCHLAMSEGRRFPENARLIFETGPGRGLENATQFLREINDAGRIRVSDPRWAAGKLLALIMPLMDFMKSGMQALQPPTREEIRKTVVFFLKGIDETVSWPPHPSA